ncbi:MAG: PAS domain S-box protein [bacterium]
MNLACETKLRRKDGRLINVEASTAIIQYNGKPATMGIVRDVTERKRMEEELLKIEKCESICRGKGEIFFMDDDKALRDTMGDILLYLGYQIEFVQKMGVRQLNFIKKHSVKRIHLMWLS